MYSMTYDSQFGSVLGDVIRDFGEFLVGAVDRGALTAALLGAGQVCEAIPSQFTPIILGTWSQTQTGRQPMSSSPNNLTPAFTGKYHGGRPK